MFGLFSKSKPELAPQQEWTLAAAGNLARANKVSLERLSLGFPKSLVRSMLKSAWDIKGADDVMPTLTWLANEGHRAKFQSLYETLRGIPAAQFEEEVGRYSRDDQRLYRFVYQHYDQFANGDILAWDLARYIYVTRAAFNAGYIDEGQGWHLANSAATVLRSSLTSWKELSTNFRLGRRYWQGGATEDRDHARAAEWLENDPKSPWQRLPWALNVVSMDAFTEQRSA